MSGWFRAANWKGLDKKQSWPVLKEQFTIYFEGLRKATLRSVRMAGAQSAILIGWNYYWKTSWIRQLGDRYADSRVHLTWDGLARD